MWNYVYQLKIAVFTLPMYWSHKVVLSE